MHKIQTRKSRVSRIYALRTLLYFNED